MKITKILTILIVSILLIISFNNILFTQDGQSLQKFDYNFSNTRLGIDEYINIKIELTDSHNIPKAININKEILEKTAFRIVKIDYNSHQTKDTPLSGNIKYILDLTIGVRLNIITEYGIYEFPSIEIQLVSLKNPDDVEKYVTAPQDIEIIRPFNFNVLLLSIITASIIGITLVIFIILKMINKNKQEQKNDGISIEELSETTYKRYLDKKDKYIHNKDKQDFLNSTEKLIISFILRKYNLTSIDEFYQNSNPSDEEKIMIKNTLSNIEMSKLSDSKILSNEELDVLSDKIKILLKNNTLKND